LRIGRFKHGIVETGHSGEFWTSTANLLRCPQ
jgi:hypothetical protein